MPIIYHQSSQTFHLYNNHISYIFKVIKNGHLANLYFGKRIKDKENFDYLFETSRRAMAVCTYEDDMNFSLEHIRQEYPAYGNGDMHTPAFDLLSHETGSRLFDFIYDHHVIYNGKKEIKDIPSVYVEDENEMTSLEVVLIDPLTEVELTLFYTIDENRPAIMRHTEIKNNSKHLRTIQRLMSLSLDMPDANYEMVELTGAWSRERHVQVRPLNHGITAIQSMRGHSSNNFNPFIALKRPETTENQGEVIGVSLVYSGNFLANVEVDTYNVSRITMGIHPQNFTWNLNPNETFTTPEAVLVYSQKGLSGMSQVFHNLYGKRLAHGYWRDRPRPILINNWEGTYFDFTEEKILSIAKAGKEMGMELFVLDDGWFGTRNDDFRGLGDWYPNLNKLPEGIAGLSRKVEELGIMFGLWFEPEMVNEDSDLFRAHPEWRLSTPNRRASQGRHQYILDYSNKDVVDYIYGLMDKVIGESKISYIKWDMNRSMSEVYSTAHPADQQGEVMHRYILGVYDLYRRLTTKYPHILFESCSSGGARFDPAMLYFAPQAWASDNSDAVSRLKIQYGTSMVYPISSIGAHISAVPNHQVDRMTSLKMRGDVAYFGTFGYELDLTKLSAEEKAQAMSQIQWMKEHRELIQFGTFYRLLSPFEGNYTSWMVVSEDKKEAIVGWYRVLGEVNVGYHRVKLQGLNEDLEYTINDSDVSYSGDLLMNAGLITSDHMCGETRPDDMTQRGDFTSKIFHIKAK